jgi:hypothetical protein
LTCNKGTTVDIFRKLHKCTVSNFLVGANQFNRNNSDIDVVYLDNLLLRLCIAFDSISALFLLTFNVSFPNLPEIQSLIRAFAKNSTLHLFI